MIRFIGIVFISLWILELIGIPIIYLCALVFYCNGQYLGFTIDIILSLIMASEVIDNVNQIPNYFYYIKHNRWMCDKPVVPLMIWKDNKDK